VSQQFMHTMVVTFSRRVDGIHPASTGLSVTRVIAASCHVRAPGTTSIDGPLNEGSHAPIQPPPTAAAAARSIEPYLHRNPRELSGGQRQRVAMGRAIVRDPKVFLFDEPLSNLDAKLRVAMRAEIKALHQRLKTTTVYVTHDQVEAMTMADRIVVMQGGRIEQIGSPLELYDHPDNLFVAQSSVRPR
jgi:multiple sugar transport system ATP-binding protein